MSAPSEAGDCDAVEGVVVDCGGSKASASAPSPQLRWSSMPAAATHVAIECVDLTARHPPGGFVHWLQWNVPAGDVRRGAPPSSGVLGLNSYGKLGYGPPCPPVGSGRHRYKFTVHALSAPLRLAERSDVKAFREAVAAAVPLASCSRSVWREQK